MSFNKLGLTGSILALAMLSSATVLALPSHATAHAMSTPTTVNSGSSTGGSNTGSTNAPTTNDHQATGQANGRAHLAAAQLKACQNRQAAIDRILTRIDTRAQNQLTLFSTIATRVESFYTTQGKTLTNYDQLVAAVNTSNTQAETDFGTMKTSSTFSCSASDPKGIVSSFQSYLRLEISDLRNYRTAVKNLIVGVSSVTGGNTSASSNTNSTKSTPSTQGGN